MIFLSDGRPRKRAATVERWHREALKPTHQGRAREVRPVGQCVWQEGHPRPRLQLELEAQPQGGGEEEEDQGQEGEETQEEDGGEQRGWRREQR